ncbi:uncharacterized protein LOC127737021 [Mytilus californianus]|uniref:uncharacterized protein LOC127737021 n=1 Tax=Mytilus californianus TaxID=6549 RepID=UPI0022468EC9|nr:uncharacterized protein LOC127737021 [Mytilus californianus]
MMKIVLLFASLFAYVDCFVKVENYKNSVYIMRGYSKWDKFEKAADTTVFEPSDYDLMSDKSLFWVEGCNKKGHLLQFYKYEPDTMTQYPVLKYYFTNEEYYQKISTTIIEQMTYHPVVHVKMF